MRLEEFKNGSDTDWKEIVVKQSKDFFTDATDYRSVFVVGLTVAVFIYHVPIDWWAYIILVSASLGLKETENLLKSWKDR